jgi:hypothetical protein
MSLYDHKSKAGDYLKEGNYLVKITKAEMFKYNSGSLGVQFRLRDQEGGTSKVSFCLKDNIVWRLTDFATACGLSDTELKTYNETSPNSHQRLVGKKVMVRIVKNGKYHEVAEDNGFWAVGSTPPAAARVAAPEPAQEPEEYPERAYDGTDDPPEPVPEAEDLITGEAPWM